MSISATSLDALYNNRERVPDHQLIVQRWKQESNAALKRLRWELVSYGDDAREQIHVFEGLSGLKADMAIPVFVHGGYWTAGDAGDHVCHLESLVEHAGAAAAISYPLRPAVALSDIVEAVGTAVRVLATKYVGRRLVLIGHSAGAHLALWGAQGSKSVRTVIGLSGVYSLEPLRKTTFLGPLLGVDAAGAARLDASNADTNASLFLTYGELESEAFREQAQSLESNWIDSGKCARSECIPSAHHFSILDELRLPESSMAKSVRSLLCHSAESRIRFT